MRSSGKSGKSPTDSRNRMRAASCLGDSFLVEAGAGTGKTALIMDRLRNIICASGAPMESIAAITFTEKAAAELKSRLRTNLEEWEAAAEGREKERAGAALRSIDRAAVCTIHSFCSTLIRERPVEAGVDPGFAVADAAEAEGLRDIAWDAWLEERMVADNRMLRPVFEAGASTQVIRGLADSLLKHWHLLHWSPAAVDLPSPRSLIAEVERELAAFEDIAGQNVKKKEDKLLAEANKVRSFLELAERRIEAASGEAERFWGALAPAMAGLNIRTKRRGSAANWTSKESLGRARELLSGIDDFLKDNAGAYSHNAVVYLIEELKIFVNIYQKVKRERGVLDFDDLLIVARDMLKDSWEVRRYYKNRFKAILIDEFQDTDPLQAEVAFLLAERPDGAGEAWDEVDLERGKLFIVGDPKQSIYRFRGADIEIYEKSKRILEGSGEVLPIYVNFRSTPGIIDPVNLTFEHVMRPPEEGDYQPDYIPLSPFRESGSPGLEILRAGTEFADLPPADDRRAYEASAVAWSIREAVDKKRWTVYDKAAGADRPATYGDIALLFRATTGLSFYEEALRSWEVPYRVAGGKAYYARAEVRELTSVLTAVERPHDGVAVFGALRSVFFGLSDEKIFLHWSRAGGLDYTRVDAQGSVGRAFAVLRELRELRNSVRLVTFMELLFERTGALPSLFMRPQGEQRVANLMKMSAMASRLEESGPITFKRFVRWVSDRGVREVDEGESPVRETGDDFVTVLTIHKAKGLEFPVVYLPGLWSTDRKDVGPVVLNRGAENLQVCLSKTLGLSTLDWEAASKREGAVLEAEKIRLLYVAMTRARDRLVLPCLFGAGYAAEGKGKILGHFKHLETLLDAVRAGGAKWADDTKVPPKGLDRCREKALRLPGMKEKAGGHDFGDTLDTWLKSLERTLENMASYLPVTSPTGLTPKLEAALGPKEIDAPPGGKPGLEGEPPSDVGRKIGSLVHSVLERDPSWDSQSMQALAMSLGTEAGLRADAIDHASGLLARFSESAFAKRLRAARFTGREVPFCLPLEATVEGVADLVIEEDDGWRVVDFKTDGVAEDEVEERANHYRMQGACYALCLSKILRRPIKEIIFYFLTPQKAHIFEADEALHEDARRAIAALATGASQPD